MQTKAIGVIGLGSIGMRHAMNMLKLEQHVVGFDPDTERQKELYASGGAIAENINDMLNVCDGMMIASPTPWHRQHITDCFSFDCSVFVEKPIADVLDEDLGWVQMVGYNLRFHSSVVAAKKMIKGGEIGIPLWANFVCSQKTQHEAYLRDGVILNWSHEIDLAMHLLGPATLLTSSTRVTNGFDDLTDIILMHDGGCRTSIHLDYLGDPEIRKFTVMGTEGTLTGNLTTPRFVVKHRAGTAIMPVEYGTDTFDKNYITEAKEFLGLMEGKETIACTGDEALNVLEICQQVQKQAGLI